MAVFGKRILLFCRQFTFLPKGKSCFSQVFVFYFVPSIETVILSFLVILYTVLDNTTVDGRYISLNFRQHFFSWRVLCAILQVKTLCNWIYFTRAPKPHVLHDKKRVTNSSRWELCVKFDLGLL